MKKGLPKNWIEVSLSEITKNVKGKKPKIQSEIEFEGSIPYMDIKALEYGVLRQYADIESSKLFEEGDIAMVWDGARSGWVSKTNFGAIGSTIVALKPINFNSDFLYYYLLEKYPFINSNARGVGIPHVDPTVFWGLKFPLPPLEEQKRIVSKLDTFFAQLENIKTSMEKIPVLLKKFRQQVLTQAVAGKLTEEWRKGKNLEEWREDELGKICNLKAGKFVPSSEISNEKQEGYYPCYGGNGLRGYVKSFTHIGKYSLIGRQGALCGNVHLIEGQFHATEHALVVTPLTKIDEIWLFFKLTSLELINYSKGVAQPGLSVMNLNPIPITIPPIKEQKEIVARIDSLFTTADAIEKKYKSLKQKIDILPQAILHKAFKGELTGQLDSDGDARELLRQIQELKIETSKKEKKNKIRN